MSSAALTVAGYMRKAERALDEGRLLLRDENARLKSDITLRRAAGDPPAICAPLPYVRIAGGRAGAGVIVTDARGVPHAEA